MMSEPATPDPESVEKWRNLPQNNPSPKALPPLMGGSQQLKALLFVAFIILVLGYLLSRG
ncbi:MAG TPA: hypothetical protein VK003_11770 [Oceanobacillus sp.]|nr:hypothetical protein [Oceanobacillus sp.]